MTHELTIFVPGALFGLWAGWMLALVVLGRCLRPRETTAAAEIAAERGVGYARGYSEGWSDRAELGEEDVEFDA